MKKRESEQSEKINCNVAESLKPLLVGIDKIKPDPKNARAHNKRNLDAIKKSLEAYGQRKPIVVNAQNDQIEAGNGLFIAASEMGWTHIAVVYVNDSDITQKAYSIMDNQSALLAEWDIPNLKDILTELDTGALDMDITGFSGQEIEDMMNQIYIPEDNEDINENAMKNTHNECPKCGFKW